MSALAITFICIAAVLILLFVAYFCTVYKQDHSKRN